LEKTLILRKEPGLISRLFCLSGHGEIERAAFLTIAIFDFDLNGAGSGDLSGRDQNAKIEQVFDVPEHGSTKTCSHCQASTGPTGLAGLKVRGSGRARGAEHNTI